MAEILFVRNTPLGMFLSRRISRVWPALFVFVTLCWVAGLLGYGTVTWREWLAAVTFTSNYAAVYGLESDWIHHTWSLSIEEHTYFLLALLAFWTQQQSIQITKLLVCLIVAMILNGAWQTIFLAREYHDVYWRTDVRAASILIGAVAFLWLRDRRANGLTVMALGVGGLLLNLNSVPDPVKYSLGTAMVASCIALLPSAPQTTIRFLSSRPVLFVGAVSYSLYLWQQPFAKSIVYGEDLMLRFGSSALLLAGAVMCAWVSWKYIEGPARSYLDRAWSGRFS